MSNQHKNAITSPQEHYRNTTRTPSKHRKNGIETPQERRRNTARTPSNYCKNAVTSLQQRQVATKHHNQITKNAFIYFNQFIKSQSKDSTIEHMQEYANVNLTSFNLSMMAMHSLT
ncbi:hypothetical protein C2G38_2192697 [Gigaspora rosea]|uniref:Uncharacterized protein n=1 Tax=Gigaspora rosea TaxID=44941 RepID=A0A397UYT9_9GLOM|nr:hypothetical protein C2G38_2192697 [Gigaspora rosea]